MLTYAARAVPWGRVVLAAVLVVVLMDLVRRDPWTLWPLQGTTVGLLAGAAAWCFDETAADVLDAAPRGLAWQAAARSPGPLLLVLAWVTGVVRAGDDGLLGHPGAVLVQGLSAILVGTAVAAWRRGLADAVPGLRFAGFTVPAVAAWALVRPLQQHVAVFPYGTTSPLGWSLSAAGWTLVGVGAALVLAAALGEAPWWHLRRGRSRPVDARGSVSAAPAAGSRPRGR